MTAAAQYKASDAITFSRREFNAGASLLPVLSISANTHRKVGGLESGGRCGVVGGEVHDVQAGLFTVERLSLGLVSFFRGSLFQCLWRAARNNTS